MVGIIPLTIQVPASEPTINKIKMAPAVLCTLLATSSIIVLNFTLFRIPTIAATAPPNNRMN